MPGTAQCQWLQLHKEGALVAKAPTEVHVLRIAQDSEPSTADGADDHSGAGAGRRRQLFASGPSAFLLRHASEWEALPALLREHDAPAGFVAACLTLLLQVRGGAPPLDWLQGTAGRGGVRRHAHVQAVGGWPAGAAAYGARSRAQ